MCDGEKMTAYTHLVCPACEETSFHQCRAIWRILIGVFCILRIHSVLFIGDPFLVLTQIRREPAVLMGTKDQPRNAAKQDGQILMISGVSPPWISVIIMEHVDTHSYLD